MPPRFSTATLPARAAMGVLNVTPDSFSDGGRFAGFDGAVAHGGELLAQGADLVDVGGESTRPHAEPVPADEEARRVVPVVAALRALHPAAVLSVDTMKASVAAAALDAGASIVNDVTAGRFDTDMLRVVADHDAAFVAMHMQGVPATMQDSPHYADVVREVGVVPATMQDSPHYADVVREVGDFLLARLDAARTAGVRDDALLADPGIGFGKTIDHNLTLLRALPELVARVGVPLVVGASRKTFLGTLTGGASVDDREAATLAVSVWAFDAGVRVVRVHDVAPSARAARLLDVVARATQDGIAA